MKIWVYLKVRYPVFLVEYVGFDLGFQYNYQPFLFCKGNLRMHYILGGESDYLQYYISEWETGFHVNLTHV